MNLARSALIPLLLAIGVVGCATRPVSDVNSFAMRSASNSFEVVNRGVDPSGLVLPVVLDRQTTTASCGAHAIASVINYWRGPGAADGDGLFRGTPPADAAGGYSLSELRALAQENGLLASAARLSQAEVLAELENGRPVLIPIRAPAVYLEARTLPGQGVPLIGFVRNVAVSWLGRIAEQTGMAMVSHYVVVAGYEDERFVVVDPVQGFRTIGFDRLERYRRPFGDAALVFSASPQGAT